jgi:hypothetical protein
MELILAGLILALAIWMILSSSKRSRQRPATGRGDGSNGHVAGGSHKNDGGKGGDQDGDGGGSGGD